ncbi:MAG: metallophosphoesterase [Bacteroidales bacterium]|nr:metallophosphoesterase [Bacteroidales bacterium]
MTKLTTEEKKRLIWAVNRSVLELENVKYRRNGKKSKSHWNTFEELAHIFAWLLKIIGWYDKGVENAKNIALKEITLEFNNLPEEFDNYRILHLTDLHIDSIPGLEDIIIDLIKPLKYDLCVMSGDYRKNVHGSFRTILQPMSKIANNIQATDGIFAVLGNHDTYFMDDYQKEVGIRLLVNESKTITRGKEQIVLTGTDDPYHYYTEQALLALEEEYKGFKIALIHTPELADLADNNGYSFYLCGHTHGGQICLPNGKPIITHQYEGKKFYNGLWHYGGVTGYTSPGCGVSGIPLRFNSQGEVTVFTLKRKPSQ